MIDSAECRRCAGTGLIGSKSCHACDGTGDAQPAEKGDDTDE